METVPQAEYFEPVSPAELRLVTEVGRAALNYSADLEGAETTETLITDSLPKNAVELKKHRQELGLDPLDTNGLNSYKSWKNKTNRHSR